MIRKRRTRPRRGKATNQQKRAVRLIVFERSGGVCELKLREDCLGWVPWDGPDIWSRGHAAHILGAGAGGEWTPENIRRSCWRCHLIGLHVEGGNGKIIPAKQTAALETRAPWADRIDA